MAEIIEGSVAGLFLPPEDPHSGSMFMRPVAEAHLTIGVVTDVDSLTAVYAELPKNPAFVEQRVRAFEQQFPEAPLKLERHLAWLASTMGVQVVLNFNGHPAAEHGIPDGSVWGPYDPESGKNTGLLFGLERNLPPNVPPKLADDSPNVFGKRGWQYRALTGGVMAVGQPVKIVVSPFPKQSE